MRWICLLVLFLQAIPAQAQDLAHRSERWTYTLRYRGIPAASAVFATEPTNPVDSAPGWQFSIEVKLNAPLNSLFQVENRYQAFVDRQTQLPYRIVKTIQQSNVNYQRTLLLNQQTGLVTSVTEDTSWQLGMPVFDLVSMLFCLRLAQADSADTLRFNLDCEMPEWQALAVHQGDQPDMKTKIGTMAASLWLVQFVPVQLRSRPWKTDMLTNQTVQKNASLFIWLSADDRRIPLQIQYFRNKKLIDLLIQKDAIR